MKSRKMVERFPELSPAGIQKEQKINSVSDCLLFQQNSTTPEKLKKFRKNNLLQVGKVTLHSGNYQDVQNMNPNLIHGMKSDYSEKLECLLKNSENEGFLEEVNKNKEKIYKSNKEAPLGKSFSRNYFFPTETKNEGFEFGLKTIQDQTKNKPLKLTEEEEKKQKNLYKKSHNNYEPGEQKKRNYNWKIEENSHVFGKKNNKEDNIQQCLKNSPEEIVTTKIISQNVKQCNEDKVDQLGKSKTNKINPVFEFKENKKNLLNGVAECLSFPTSLRDNRDQEQIGQCLKQGCKNVPKEGDEKKSFGLTTQQISLINMNKTNEKETKLSFFELLNYNYDNSKKTERTEFLKPRNLQEIQELSKAVKMRLKPEVVKEIFTKQGKENVSLDEFIKEGKKMGLLR